MTTLLVQHQVRDYKEWKKAFIAFSDIRIANGELTSHVYHDQNDHNNVTIVCEWESLQSAQKFAKSSALQQVMQKAGVISKPNVHFLNKF